MITPRQYLHKNELAQKLNMTNKTLSRILNEHESKIKEIYPSYTRYAKILFPKVIDYIIHELGYSHEEIYGS